MKPIAILGAGSWGTALALYLAHRGQEVRLWTYDDAHAAAMQAERENKRYLPGFIFPACLFPTSELSAVMAGDCDVLIAVPSAYFRETLLQLQPWFHAPRRIVWATKGLDKDGRFLHESVQEVLGDQSIYAVLSGPSFAKEVAEGKPTAVVIASPDSRFVEDLMHRFHSPLFRIYPSDDVIGVEIGGITKNIFAIATGISDGMQLGANARSALITRGLAEMIRLGTAWGGKYETFMGLAGIGDLVLTATDSLSRNRRFGLAVGSGKTVHDAAKEIQQVIEGKENVFQVIQLAKKVKIEMPITEMVGKILEEKVTLQQAVEELLARGVDTNF